MQPNDNLLGVPDSCILVPGQKIKAELYYMPQAIAVSGSELIVIAGQDKILKFSTTLNKWVELPAICDSNIATKEEVDHAQQLKKKITAAILDPNFSLKSIFKPSEEVQ